MVFVIDRFEGDYAVLEQNGKTCNVPKKMVQASAREGDVVARIEDRWEVDREATARRKAEIEALAESLWRDEP